jgi:uncharacterized membrane protein
VSDQPSSIHKWLCIAAVLAGLCLRFHRLGESLWYDEAISVRTASAALSQMPHELTKGEDSNPPLYPILLKGWMGLFGGTDAAIHALSAVIGVLAVASAWWAGWMLGGPGAGMTAAALMSLHPWAVVYSQEARAYELLVLVSLWSCLFLARAVRERDRMWWALWAAASAVNLYTHNYAVFLLIAQALWCAFALHRRREPLAALAVVALAYAPWIVFALKQTRALPQLAPLGLRDVVYTLYSEAGLWVMAGPMVCHWPPGYLTPLLIVRLGLAVWAFSALLRRERRLAFGLLAMIALSVAVPMLVSLARPIYTTGRHNIVALPALCLLMALALESVPKGARLMILGFVLMTWTYPLAAYFSAPKSYERQVADFVRAHDGDGYRMVVSPEYRRVTLAHYYPKAAEAAGGVEVRSLDDLPKGLIVVTEYPRVLSAAQTNMLERYYKLDDKGIFGLSTVEVLSRRPGD